MFDIKNNKKLLERSLEGDKSAFEELINGNMGLVRSIAVRFKDRGTDVEDLVQIGAIGLIKAARNFDLSAGTQFSTYAVPLIMGEIKKHLRDDGIIKVSRELKRIGTQISINRNNYIKEHGEEPTVSVLAELCGVSEDEVIRACEASAPMLSFSAPAGETTLEAVIGIDNIGEMNEKISLRQALGSLSGLEREIIYLRYFKELSQSRVGELLDMTQVMVSRKEKKILEKMRINMD